MNTQGQNTFGSIWMDNHPAQAPNDKATYALNASRQTYHENNFGYVNELGTELCAKLPDGYKMRGYSQIAETEEFIVFLFNGTNSVIASINTETCEYHEYLNDKDTDCLLNFGFHEWINIEVKRIQPCNERVLYWTNNRTYRYLNIDRNHPEGKKLTCEDFRLFKCNCVPYATARVIENGGYGIQNGKYQVAVRLTDEDGNYTNFSLPSEPVKIYGGDNIAGEPSYQYLNVEVTGLSKNYNFIDVVLIKKIGGKTTAHYIYEKFPYNSNGVFIEYRGAASEIRDISLTELLVKNNYYINGGGLKQKDNRLILFDVDNYWNVNYQKQVNEFEVGWAAYRVRVEDAHKYPSLMGSENYIFGVRLNYCDNTHSPDFPIINLNKPNGGDVSDPCTDCNIPFWELEDTSTIDWVHSGYGDPFQESEASDKTYTDFKPTKEFYKTLNEWAEEHIDEAVNDINEVNELAKDNLNDEGDILDGGYDCCDSSAINTGENSEFLCEGVICPLGCKCVNGECRTWILGLPCPGIVIPPPKGNEGTSSTINQYYGSRNNSSGGGGGNDDGPVICSGLNCTDEECPEGCICVDTPLSRPCEASCTPDSLCLNGCTCVKVGEDYVCVPEEKPRKVCISLVQGRSSNSDPNGGGKTAVNNAHDSNVPCLPIYDEDGCTVVDCIPRMVARGKFGYSESNDTIPETLDCENNPIWGEYAGKPIGLFKTPSREKVPHFISYQTGVKNILETGNDELDRGYVQVFGITIDNIKLPTRTPKPLCEHTPFTITMRPRDPANKTVLAKGIFLPTFEGEVYADTALFPRNGVASLELFNRHIHSSTNKYHGGYLSDVPGYTFHSPTTTFGKPFIGGTYSNMDLEIYGKGWQHGLYGLGNEPGVPEIVGLGGIRTILSKGSGLNVPKIGQKGNRSVIHLNKYIKPLTSVNKRYCVKDASYVDADSVLPKGPNFSKVFNNKDSEACVFIELNEKLRLQKGIDLYLSDNQYNGYGNVEADQSADGSFLGDVKYHSKPIYNAATHYGGIYIKNPRQYGRLEKAAFIPTGVVGTWDNILSGSIDGWCGDTYISPYSFTKSTYVSNLVGENVLINNPLDFSRAEEEVQAGPETGEGKNGGKAQKGAKGLKKLIANMTGQSIAWAMCMCGNIPVSGLDIDIDPRNGGGLRGFPNDGVYGGDDSVSQGGGMWEGPPTQFEGNSPKPEKVYYPGVLKTEIIYWVESEIAVPLRETKHEEDKEINYFNTKSYGLDSSFTGNFNWKTMYMNKFYMELPEVSLFQKLLITLTILFVKIILPLYIVIEIGAYIQGGGGIFGSLLSIIIQIVMVLLVVVMIILLFITLKTFASEYLLQFLGLKQCFNDKQGGPGDGFKRDFHDNYAEYNFDYSDQNDLSVGFAPPINYNVCECVAEPSNAIIYSNPQMVNAPNDAWRNFKINNVLELGNNYGKVTDLIIIRDKLYAACTDMIYDLRTGLSTMEISGDLVHLGKGDYINGALPLVDGLLEGYAGIKYPNGSIDTPMGRIFIDEEAGRIYNFNGQFQEVSNQGVRQFMKNNLKFQYLDYHPDFALVDKKTDLGIGYAIGYDYQHERILITKRDFIPDINGDTFFNGEMCKDISWTLSFDPTSQTWISFHSYVPHLYMYNRFNIFAENEGAIWKFNAGKKYQTYFGKYYPHIIEYVAKVDGFYAINHHYTDLETEANMYEEIPYKKIKDLNITFNKLLGYNTNQSTNILNLGLNPASEDMIAAMKESTSDITISRQGRNWRISNLKDFVNNPLAPIIYKDPAYRAVPVNGNYVENYKHQFLEDKYLVIQLTLDNRDDIELISRGALTLFNKPEE